MNATATQVNEFQEKIRSLTEQNEKLKALIGRVKTYLSNPSFYAGDSRTNLEKDIEAATNPDYVDIRGLC